ncbi:permease prefix domain 1-containing protein [Metaclostridioides mangenotii]|uniref:Uncharacterized protein n=1 Tax=Metaclostridioides mangenotii TaxID=1540 RepID=A0ABS4ED93_9FIRM|nr:permease prefix domain 1-containing protein [Clostridioides mangenotii]MBP1855922.1 hypothetical protein [Clostridioides mangenotii]
MKAIDEYLNRLYKNSKSNEIIELKEEMREHLIESVNELINKGYSEDDAIKEAISRFDGGSEMTEEINTEYIEKSNLKKIRNIFLIFLVLTIISLFMGYNNISLSIESIKSSKVEEKLRDRLYAITKSNNINNITSFKSRLDKLLDESEFDQIASIDIYNQINYIPELQPENVSKIKNKYEITNLPNLEEKYNGREKNLIYHYGSKEPEEYLSFDGETKKNELGQTCYYLIKYKNQWYYDLETKVSIVLGTITVVIFARYYILESEHLKKKDKK